MEQWTLIYLNGKKTNHYVSNFGNVKNSNNKLTRQSIVTVNENGVDVNKYYCSIAKLTTLATLAKYDYVPVDMLVAKAFLMNPTKLHAVNHLDGNSLNNNVENLRWI
jgi:uncharacterized protein YlbG (UPF0298 family)